MNRLILFLFLIGSVIYPLTNVKALHTFAPKEVTQLTWGSTAGQVALIKAPANNFAPPRLLIDESGVSLYLLDSPNQRIVVFNLEKSQFSTVQISSNEQADDFCVLDNGKHFYLLFNQSQKLILYNQKGEQLSTYSLGNHFNPLSVQCDPKRGLIFQATDGHFYRFGDDTPLTLMPQGQYGFFIDKQSESKGILLLHNRTTNLSQEIAINSRAGLLETLDFVGVDNKHNVYLTVEEMTNKGKTTETVRRFLRQYNDDGQLEAEREIPYSFFAYTLDDLIVTKSGEVFQMVPLKKHLKIVKWVATETTRSFDPLSPQLFSYLESQVDDFLPSETETDHKTIMRGGRLPPIYRYSIMEKAKAFANADFYVNWNNISRGKYLGGKKVITPISRSGYYKGIPYKWGGFDTINSFNNGLKEGKKAGDKKIIGSRGSKQAVGVDCSGFVSQVWGLQDKKSTHSLPYVSRQLYSFNQLQPGDILNKKGHVRLFAHKDVTGRFWLYEASSKDWKVSTRSYTSYSLKREGYKPYRYKNVIEYASPSLPSYWRKKPTRFYIYGKKAIGEGRSSDYRAKVFYSDGTYQDVTHRTHWTENSRYTHFKGARLYTKWVKRNRYAYIKASSREKGHSLSAGIYVTIRNTQSRGLSHIGELPDSSQQPINIDIQYRYRPNKGKGEVNTLTDGHFLYSGDAYQIIFTPTEKTYVYIFQTDSSQNVYRLFPMKSFKGVTLNNSNPVLAGQTYSIPSQNKWFFLDNQMGQETIYFIATRKPQLNLEQQFQQIEIARHDNNSAELDLAQTQLFEEEIKQRAVKKTIPSDEEAGQPFSMLKQHFKTCEGCLNVLEFWHR